MKKLGKNGIKTLKIFHLFFSIMWIGGGIALTTVLFISEPVSGDELYFKFRIMQIIDDFIIIPGAITSFLIGIIYGVWTKWGFFKHHWITIKWILTFIQILFGTFFLGPWLNTNVDILQMERIAAINNPDFIYNVSMTATWGTAQVALLLLMVVISVYKPFGRRNNPDALAA